MALYGDLTHDSRVIREADSLALAGHRVTIVCLDAASTTVERLSPRISVVISRPPSWSGRSGEGSPFLARGSSRRRRLLDRARWLWDYERALRKWGRTLAAAAGPVDVWHAHDLTGLQAVAHGVGRSVPIVYDSHELFLETGSAARLPGPARQLLRAREARLVQRCTAVVTVNLGLARELERRYRPARIEVVRNCAPRWPSPAKRPNLIRAALGLDHEAAIVLFHGALESDRGIEQLIAAVGSLGLRQVHLVLLGFPDPRTDFAGLARQRSVADQVHVLPAVSPDELPDWVASADVGAVLQQPTTLNLRLSTPNKLYEAIAVGTPVIASDLPEIARILEGGAAGPLGILCDPTDLGAIESALRSLLAQPRTGLAAMRNRCLQEADARLNWETEAAGLLSLYADLSRSLGGQLSRS
jgi:glycosyltransferase involved in cell wall biosynthesis